MAKPARLAVLVVLLVLVWAQTLAAVRPDSMAASIDLGPSVQMTADRPARAVAAPTPTFTSPPGPTPAPRGPSISYFTCDPCVLEPGEATTLRWDLNGATAAYLDGEGVTAPGSSVVYPDQTTTYRLVAVSQDGQSVETVTVEVRGLPTIHYFTCLPCEVPKGGQSTLSWDLSGATAAYLDDQGVTAPGGMVVAPAQTTTYRLIAVNERGSVERLVTVTVKESGDPEEVSALLRQPGYDVRWVGYLPLAEGGNTISVVMAPITGELDSQELASQYFDGFKVLFDGYPGETLTVGLPDDTRYIVFGTVEWGAVEALLRGKIDDAVFWQAITWNVWDDWTGRWLEDKGFGFGRKSFASKDFGF